MINWRWSAAATVGGVGEIQGVGQRGGLNRVNKEKERKKDHSTFIFEQSLRQYKNVVVC